jgi:hypothetical protein
LSNFWNGKRGFDLLVLDIDAIAVLVPIILFGKFFGPLGVIGAGKSNTKSDDFLPHKGQNHVSLSNFLHTFPVKGVSPSGISLGCPKVTTSELVIESLVL